MLTPYIPYLIHRWRDTQADSRQLWREIHALGYTHSARTVCRFITQLRRAADAGHRVAHTVVHVHGGVGIDVDHPVHRYFLAAKQTEFALGSATGQLRRIGRELADTPV